MIWLFGFFVRDNQEQMGYFIVEVILKRWLSVLFHGMVMVDIFILFPKYPNKRASL